MKESSTCYPDGPGGLASAGFVPSAKLGTPAVFGSYKEHCTRPAAECTPYRRAAAAQRIAAFATRSAKSATAIMTAKPIENFTNSTKNGSARRIVLFLSFFGSFICLYLYQIILRRDIGRVEPHDFFQEEGCVGNVEYVLVIRRGAARGL